jgi:hypothetical protein
MLRLLCLDPGVRGALVGWFLLFGLALAAACVPEVRAALFLPAFWLTYALVFGSPFILACLLIWWLIRRVDRGARRRGFDVMPSAGRGAAAHSGEGRTR